MIGDLLVDLVLVCMCDNYELLGEIFSELYCYYQEVSGEVVDVDVVCYYMVLFFIVSIMQFFVIVVMLQFGDLYDIYIEFDLVLCCVVVYVLVEVMGIVIEVLLLIFVEVGVNVQLLMMFVDVVGQIEVGDDFQVFWCIVVFKLVEYLGCVDVMEVELWCLEWEDVEVLLGWCFEDFGQIDFVFEVFVCEVGVEYDECLLCLFMVQVEWCVQVFGGMVIGVLVSYIDLFVIEVC